MTLTRTLLAAVAGLAAVLAVAGAPPAVAETTLRVVMHSDLKIVDPIWTTAYISRNHGYMVYDTLFALDEKLEVQPQMVDSYEISDDQLIYTFTLRDGLMWHDGQPVTAEDAIASIERWGAEGQHGPAADVLRRRHEGGGRRDLRADARRSPTASCCCRSPSRARTCRS